MSSESEQDRTEKATPKRLKDERQKGNVAKSHDLIAALSLLGIVILFFANSKNQAEYAYNLVQYNLSQEFTLQIEPAAFISSLSSQLLDALSKLAMLFVVVLLSSIAANLLQSGVLFLPGKCAPQFSRINPFKNFARIFSFNTIGQAIFGCLKVAIVLAILYLTLKKDMETIVCLPNGSTLQIIFFAFSFFQKLFIALCGTFLFLGILDYFIIRYKRARDLRMTPQEVKDEQKEESGDPMVKGKRKMMIRSVLKSALSPIEQIKPVPPESRFRNSSKKENKIQNE